MTTRTGRYNTDHSDFSESAAEVSNRSQTRPDWRLSFPGWTYEMVVLVR